MSYVTSVVITTPAEHDRALVREIGERVYAAHAHQRGREVGTDEDGGPEYYAPISQEHSNGGKYPTGSLWWLGLNYASMTAIVEALQDERFNGTTVWWMDEEAEMPSVVTIGG